MERIAAAAIEAHAGIFTTTPAGEQPDARRRRLCRVADALLEAIEEEFMADREALPGNVAAHIVLLAGEVGLDAVTPRSLETARRTVYACLRLLGRCPDEDEEGESDVEAVEQEAEVARLRERLAHLKAEHEFLLRRRDQLLSERAAGKSVDRRLLQLRRRLERIRAA